MHLETHYLQILILAAASVAAQGKGGQDQDPYVPTYTECPKNLRVRRADGLGTDEKSWRKARAKEVKSSLKSYLETADIEDLDVNSLMNKIKDDELPVVGLSISGGGTQSGLGGLGVWQAYDARYPPAKAAGTGGLTQILTYVTGLSGGGAMTVSLLAANNFESTADILKSANLSKPYADPSDKVIEGYYENAGAKAEAGFPVSATDVFGQFWATWLPKNWTFASWSDIAKTGSAFESGKGPMPIVTLAEVVPGVSPEIHDILYPGNNRTNGFSLTQYEVNPYEFGSWLGGRVQAFMPTRWLGTSMSKGKPQNTSECVKGFDKFSLIQGSTANAFPAWFIDDFYGIPIFAKRADSESEDSEQDIDDIAIPKSQDDNPLVQLVNETASSFDQTFNQSMFATYPNPFENYDRKMKDVSELLLVDGSLTGENNPIRPLIVPQRDVDFIIVYEASSEGLYNWVNGTSLQNTARAASEGKIPFPKIPTVATMINKNFTSQPTFFGCDAKEQTPLVLYLPNSPWTAYANYSFLQDSFTPTQANVTLENAFQLATYGDGAFDKNWPACMACAAIKHSLRRLKMNMPEQCKKCFEKHCWDGKEDWERVTLAQLDLKPRLNESLTFKEWNSTVWSSD